MLSQNFVLAVPASSIMLQVMRLISFSRSLYSVAGAVLAVACATCSNTSPTRIDTRYSIEKLDVPIPMSKNGPLASW